MRRVFWDNFCKAWLKKIPLSWCWSESIFVPRVHSQTMLTIFWLLLPPTLLCGHFLPYECWQNVNIFGLCTGKSLSEALLFAEHGEKMLCTKIVLNVRNDFCSQHVLPRFELGIFLYWTCNSMYNLSSFYGLVDA